ncbi:putative RNA processing protein Grc3 [Talaromyces proteolyticus]|uniref:Polynucleotide 5'-hydroxyl-kinase GRC3 n=1 Tax=Talaromyces proteolyticus TaxID=1131652 RepID=A0AAD4KQ46_9EURO|nr:putative RNA processing protein Grc3 [Talaromyces proteolyticus]KAH8692994.1 putative RNA processing protein Grc3 [Talaromyces proteolyticus]
MTCAGPRSAVSAVAARRARQQQQQQQTQTHAPSNVETTTEPLLKKSRNSNTQKVNRENPPRQERTESKTSLTSVPSSVEDPAANSSNVEASEVLNDEIIEDGLDITVGSTIGAETSGPEREEFETPSRLPTGAENFTLSRHRLTEKDVVYSDEHSLCVRIKEKTTLVLIGIYDIWVKRGVISIMGAKLHPSPNTYRVYAPSTHSLPVIKCVSGVEGSAEIEIQSCSRSIFRLKELSPLYHRIWNSSETVGDRTTLKGAYKRSFSILYTSSDDPLNRPLRPLHLDKKWSATIKSLSQRGTGLKVLVCGPKGAGKSTFGRYLLNHLLSPAPQNEQGPSNPDGVAYLDLDPGQPEFAPMGNIYLAHLRKPCLGPPFSHPTLENSRHGRSIRCHHIGATSPKEDSDYYALAAMNLLDQYRALLATFPQCPLVVNYPGWVFGLGLEVVTWLIRSMGLSNVIYMSEKGPIEVEEPLRFAATEAGIPLTTLPSQPIDFVSRSSAQFRSMQMQSYFHLSQLGGLQNPVWSSAPLIHHKSIHVNYSGEDQGISGIMVLGNRHDPAVLKDIINGSIVSVVAVEDANAIEDTTNQVHPTDTAEEDVDMAENSLEMSNREEEGDEASDHITPNSQSLKARLDAHVTRSPNTSLPYLFCGAGSCTPLNPKSARSLGLALVRAVKPSTQQLELITPIPSSRIRESFEQGHVLVLVRGMLDSPDWAFSEEYHAARNAEQNHVSSISIAKMRGEEGSEAEVKEQREVLQRLRGRVRRASRVPWMDVVEDGGARQSRERGQEDGIWRLRKKAYLGSDSELE